MKHHYKQLPTRIPGYALCYAVLGPWSLHGIARHLYPRLKEELQKQYYPEATNLPLLWWGAWLIVGAISPIFSSETHAMTAAILYILSGWLQAILGYFIGGLKTLKALDVLPYHDMGKAKYAQLGMDYPLSETPPLSTEDAAAAKAEIFKGLKRRLREHI